MNALLARLVQAVFIGCGVILVLWGMDVGSGDHPTFLPGVIVLLMASGMIWMQHTDKGWNKPLVHPWEWVFTAAGWGVAYYGCQALIIAVGDYFRAGHQLGDWFGGAVTACVGLFLARVGVALSK